MSKDTFTLDTSVMERALKEWSAFVVQDAGLVVLDEARLLFMDGMNLTPPYGKGKTGGQRKKGSTLAAKRQGEASVERSILNSFRPITEDKAKTEDFKRAIKSGNVDTLNAYLEGTKSKKRAFKFSESTHKADRDSKGRVYRSKNRLVIGSDVGAVQSYIVREQAKVGSFKAAWGLMAFKLGNHPKAQTKARIPGWVGKQMSRGKRFIVGSPVISLRRGGASVSATLMSHPQLKFAFDRAVKSRAKSMSNKVHLILDGRSKDINTKFATR